MRGWCSPSLRSVQVLSSWAEAGRIRWQVLKRVTVPLMLPGILAVGVYFSIIFIEAFHVPLAIGTTG